MKSKMEDYYWDPSHVKEVINLAIWQVGPPHMTLAEAERASLAAFNEIAKVVQQPSVTCHREVSQKSETDYKMLLRKLVNAAIMVVPNEDDIMNTMIAPENVEEFNEVLTEALVILNID